MSLSVWAKSGWLKAHTPTQPQVAAIFGVVDRDLEELREFAAELREIVVGWLAEKHPELSPWKK